MEVGMQIDKMKDSLDEEDLKYSIYEIKDFFNCLIYHRREFISTSTWLVLYNNLTGDIIEYISVDIDDNYDSIYEYLFNNDYLDE